MGKRDRLSGRGPETEAEALREADREVEAHLAMRADALVAAGMEPEAARAEALRRFGDVEEARRSLVIAARRRGRRRRWRTRLEEARRVVGHGLRRARRAPGFTALAVLVFALGVGLSTAVFTVTDHVLLRPLPFPRPDELVALEGVDQNGSPISRVSMGNWVDWKDGASSLSATALYQTARVTVGTGRGNVFWAGGAAVLGPFFRTLEVPMASGRPLREEDGQNDADVVVVSRRFWTRVLGANPDLGSLRLEVDNRAVQVVGVVAAGHEIPGGTDVWIPRRYRPGTGAMRNNINYEAVARLAAGVTPARAGEELDGIARAIRERDPEAIYSYGVRVRPLRDVVVGASRRSLELLMGAVLLVLVVACANLAGLSLARGRRRERDTEVRRALGARRTQLLAELLAEHVVVALAGGVLGVVLAAAGTEAALTLLGPVVPRSSEVAFDGRIAAFGIGASLCAGLLAGLLPALGSSRGRGIAVGSARGRVSGGRGLPGSVMVGTEMAVAVTLLVAGGLLLRSFLALTSRDLGFDPRDVATVDVALTAPEYRDMDRRLGYWDAVLQRLREGPGVAGAALGNWIPTGGGGTSFVDIEGEPDADFGAGYRVVSEDYFRVMGMRLLEGRAFDARDGRHTERVGVVTEAAAHRFWPDGSPLGRRIKATSMEAYYSGGTAPWITVIGVVADVRHRGFEDDPRPELFVLHRQIPAWASFMTVVARLRPGAARGTLQHLADDVRTLDPRLAVEARTLENRLHGLLAERRWILTGLGVFAGAALLLVCLGVYGLISYAVSERTREIAVRAALGAGRPGILTMVLGSALRVAGAGAAIGLLSALLLRKLLAAMVVGVGTADPLTYLGAGALLLVVALVAALVPSLRAARLDPVDALRRE